MASSSKLKSQVSDNIKKLRLSNEWTQEHAAEKMGFHYKYYQKIESGQVNLTLDSIWKISRAFKIEPEKLLSK